MGGVELDGLGRLGRDPLLGEAKLLEQLAGRGRRTCVASEKKVGRG